MTLLEFEEVSPGLAFLIVPTHQKKEYWLTHFS